MKSHIGTLITSSFTISILSIFITNQSLAQNSTATFLYWQPSARSYAMGGIGSALSDDIYSTYYNPAGLAFSKKITLTGSFVKPFPFFGNIANSFFGISLKIDDSNALGISSNLFWMGKQIRTSEASPEPIGVEDTPFHWNIKLSYSYLIFNNFSAGISAGILHINLSDRPVGEEHSTGTATTILVDAGILAKDLLQESTFEPDEGENKYPPFFDWLLEIGEDYRSRGFSVGMSISNLGPDIAYIDEVQSDPSPSKLLLGLTYNVFSSKPLGIVLGTDFEKRLHESNTLDYLHMGGEIKLFKVLNLRMGYFLNTIENGYSYLTYGGGISLKFLSINVARYNRSLESTWHFDSVVSFEF
jgi:hypothetical protein